MCLGGGNHWRRFFTLLAESVTKGESLAVWTGGYFWLSLDYFSTGEKEVLGRGLGL